MCVFSCPNPTNFDFFIIEGKMVKSTYHHQTEGVENHEFS